MEATLLKIKQFYECLNEDHLKNLGSIYATNASFKDPFQEVNGIKSIELVFKKMFDQLNNPKFKVIEIKGDMNTAAVLWDFEFSFKRWNRQTQSLRGVSWLYFDSEGLIKRHVDYWDPAEGIYEKLPIIGSFMRLLKKSA